MERDTRKRDDGVQEMTFKMQATSERDDWLKYFPWPIPPGHQITYRWLADQMTLAVSVEVKPDAESKRVAAATQDLSQLSEAELQTMAAEKGIDVKGKKKRQLVEDLQGQGPEADESAGPLKTRTAK